MKTRLLMSTTAVFMAALGLAATFLPHELLAQGGSEVGDPLIILVQVTGALYLGFAMLNWMARGNLIGGIYSRPVAIGNFVHFTVVAITLVQVARAVELIAVTVVYVVFAIWFGLVVFRPPVD